MIFVLLLSGRWNFFFLTLNKMYLGFFFFFSKYLFLAALGLRCCVRAFSGRSVWVSRCGGSSCGAGALG